jgi:hypothetical protein
MYQTGRTLRLQQFSRDRRGPELCRFLDAGNDEASGGVSRPASKKRQGTKSREVGHWRSNGRYGDLMVAPNWRVDVTPAGCGRRICTLARLEAYRDLGKRSERINERAVRRPQ